MAPARAYQSLGSIDLPSRTRSRPWQLFSGVEVEHNAIFRVLGFSALFITSELGDGDITTNSVYWAYG